MRGGQTRPGTGRAFPGILRAMLIDAHNHPNWHGHDADRLLANMEEHGIDQMWLFSWEVPATDYSPSYHAAPAARRRGHPTCGCPERRPGGSGTASVLGYMPDVKRPGRHRPDQGGGGDPRHSRRVRAQAAGAVRRPRRPGHLPLLRRAEAADHHPPRLPDPHGTALSAPELVVRAAPWTASSGPSPRVRRPIFIGHAPGFWGHISGDDRCMTESYPKGPGQAGRAGAPPAGHVSQPVRRPVGRLRPDGHLPRSRVRQAVPDPLSGTACCSPVTTWTAA